MPAEGSERRRSPERAATGDPHRFQTFPSPPRNGEVRPQSDHFGAGQITPIFHVLFSGQIVTAAKGGLTSWQLAIVWAIRGKSRSISGVYSTGLPRIATNSWLVIPR